MEPDGEQYDSENSDAEEDEEESDLQQSGMSVKITFSSICNIHSYLGFWTMDINAMFHIRFLSGIFE